MAKIVVCSMADKCIGYCNHKQPHKSTDSCKDFYCKSEKKYGAGCKSVEEDKE